MFCIAFFNGPFFKLSIFDFYLDCPFLRRENCHHWFVGGRKFVKFIVLKKFICVNFAVPILFIFPIIKYILIELIITIFNGFLQISSKTVETFDN